MNTRNESAPVGALLKAFSIIHQLSECKAGLAEISLRLGQPKSSTYRLMVTLAELGIVDKTENGEYFLTPKLFEYGAKALGALDLVQTALPAMQKLRNSTEETVHLAVRNDLAVVYLHKVESPHSLRMFSCIGYQAPLYCTSLGKSLLAWMESDALEKLVSGMAFESRMPNTITDANDFLTHLGLVRELGYSCDDEENEADVICFGIPVFDHYQQIKAAISVSMPKFRYTQKCHDEIITSLRQAGREASKSFGCTDWPLDARA